MKDKILTNTPEINALLCKILEAVWSTEASLYGISRLEMMEFDENDTVSDRILDILSKSGIKANARIMEAVSGLEKALGLRLDMAEYHHYQESREVQS